MMNKLLEGKEKEDPDGELEISEWLHKQHPEVEPKLRRAYGAPRACLIHTGSEDDRPGCCHTEADVWLLGWGVMAFPKAMISMLNREIIERGEWFFWVTASG